MARVLEFTPQPPSKFGFERVSKRKKESPGKQGQMNLFSGSGQVLRLPADIGRFEEALILDERNDSRAEEVYRQAISEGDSVADAYCNLGIIESKAGATAEAFDCFTKSLEHDPRHFESHYNLGNLYFEAGDFRLARMHYKFAAEIDPGFSNLYFNLGLVLASQNELQSAMDAFRNYQKLAPHDEARKADDVMSSLERSLTSKDRRSL